MNTKKIIASVLTAATLFAPVSTAVTPAVAQAGIYEDIEDLKLDSSKRIAWWNYSENILVQNVLSNMFTRKDIYALQSKVMEALNAHKLIEDNDATTLTYTKLLSLLDDIEEALDKDEEATQQYIKQLEAEIANLKNTNSNYEQAINTLNNRITELQEKIKGDDTEALKEMLTEYQNTLTSLQNKLNEQNNKDLEYEIKTLYDMVNNYIMLNSPNNETTLEQLDYFVEKLNDYYNDVNDLLKSKGDIENQLAYLKDHIEDLKDKAVDANNLYNVLKGTLDEHKEALDDLSKVTDSELKNIFQELDMFKSTVDSAVKEFDFDFFKDLQNKYNEAIKSLKDEQTLREEANAFIKKMTAILNEWKDTANNTDDYNKLYALLNNLNSFKPEFDKYGDLVKDLKGMYDNVYKDIYDKYNALLDDILAVKDIMDKVHSLTPVDNDSLKDLTNRLQTLTDYVRDLMQYKDSENFEDAFNELNKLMSGLRDRIEELNIEADFNKVKELAENVLSQATNAYDSIGNTDVLEFVKGLLEDVADKVEPFVGKVDGADKLYEQINNAINNLTNKINGINYGKEQEALNKDRQYLQSVIDEAREILNGIDTDKMFSEVDVINVEMDTITTKYNGEVKDSILKDMLEQLDDLADALFEKASDIINDRNYLQSVIYEAREILNGTDKAAMLNELEVIDEAMDTITTKYNGEVKDPDLKGMLDCLVDLADDLKSKLDGIEEKERIKAEKIKDIDDCILSINNSLDTNDENVMERAIEDSMEVLYKWYDYEQVDDALKIETDEEALTKLKELKDAWDTADSVLRDIWSKRHEEQKDEPIVDPIDDPSKDEPTKDDPKEEPKEEEPKDEPVVDPIVVDPVEPEPKEEEPTDEPDPIIIDPVDNPTVDDEKTVYGGDNKHPYLLDGEHWSFIPADAKAMGTEYTNDYTCDRWGQLVEVEEPIVYVAELDLDSEEAVEQTDTLGQIIKPINNPDSLDPTSPLDTIVPVSFDNMEVQEFLVHAPQTSDGGWFSEIWKKAKNTVADCEIEEE